MTKTVSPNYPPYPDSGPQKIINCLGNFYDKYWMYRLESHGRWYFDTDTKPDKVLEQSPNTDALCPNHIHHWLSYCSSYRSTKSSCGNVKWIPTSQPRCKPGSEPGKCCDQVLVTADENAIQNFNVTGKPNDFPWTMVQGALILLIFLKRVCENSSVLLKDIISTRLIRLEKDRILMKWAS